MKSNPTERHAVLKICCCSVAVVLAIFGGILSAARPGKHQQPAAAKPAKPVANPSDLRDWTTVAAAVDHEISAALVEAKIPESLPASDNEFIRRATLDIVGRIPTAQRAAAFAGDKSPNKRQKLIDELLAGPNYGTNFGTIWYHLLVTPNDDNRKLIRHSFADWLADEFNRNRGWNQIVRDILTASGDRNGNPATVFWFGSAVLEDKQEKLKPQAALATATHRFLGVQYQCAECHNHPFTGFKQTDFWSMVAFFGKVDFAHAKKKALKKGNGDPAVREGAAGDGAIEIPEKAGLTVTAKFPDGPAFAADGQPLRVQFADWCTSSDNYEFPRAAVNRLWAHFFGRGIVDPVDDFRQGNEPSHPELLRLLAEEFRASGYDRKHMIRCICNSQAYQRSSETVEANESDEKLFSHMALKTMSAEVLLNSLSTALGHKAVEGEPYAREGKKANKNPAGMFLQQFDTTDEPDLPDYGHGVPQVLRLMNGGDFDKSCPTLDGLLESSHGNSARIIEGLYWAAL
ncbi:MAG TPA: DUF1549 and DUF1553 domain-containing protein, partial [Pirellulales bacterium]|nr:DUF1549 and DUF1553 domain-containing protein [Pirellulales bacterium]